jgi:hypothetical protein
MFFVCTCDTLYEVCVTWPFCGCTLRPFSNYAENKVNRFGKCHWQPRYLSARHLYRYRNLSSNAQYTNQSEANLYMVGKLKLVVSYAPCVAYTLNFLCALRYSLRENQSLLETSKAKRMRLRGNSIRPKFNFEFLTWFLEK